MWRLIVGCKYVSQWSGWCFNGVNELYGDVWCGEQPLKVAFLKLFSFSYIRDAFVVDHFQFSNGSP